MKKEREGLHTHTHLFQFAYIIVHEREKEAGAGAGRLSPAKKTKPKKVCFPPPFRNGVAPQLSSGRRDCQSPQCGWRTFGRHERKYLKKKRNKRKKEEEEEVHIRRIAPQGE
jgi:hypothetical protein